MDIPSLKRLNFEYLYPEDYNITTTEIASHAPCKTGILLIFNRVGILISNSVEGYIKLTLIHCN